ncbi:ABC-F family ATP-binding cassette domain-containing protein [Flavobacterium sp. NKUCC04_CG]|uniref:ABC-F family ATP-binding cassette domain-containing protein n=1 Tax=Flavobacterium sp. NKUCC04_CG TaxID=2842121 RepID=UPI001C5AC561|nr:ABC-F family ATP-binding cassette domain-containing protein [Flavobacterium sp. NKUCC04_CG]MBW3519763.1 ATP-binding cassette domain-containing protein [Flavobacterium sp. NKUCC04_CG]
MINLQDITYIHFNRDVLFSDISFTINQHDKISLVGNNGIGKSTLLRILAGDLLPETGQLILGALPYYVPQHFGQFDGDTVAKALCIADKIQALEAILRGETTEDNFNRLDEDWTIEERTKEALDFWLLNGIDLHQKMETLSGGQKTRVFLAGIRIHQPKIVLLDEPSNHLDAQSRALVYNYIETTRDTLIVVSHDRILLNKINKVFELTKRGMVVYGGNYDFYAVQKQRELEAVSHDVASKEKALRKVKAVERASMERQQKLDARGKKKQEKAGISTIMMKTLKNKAEKSTSKIKGVHTDKRETISQELRVLREELPELAAMKIDFKHSDLHYGKVLIRATAINFAYASQELWKLPLSFLVNSGERWAIRGVNASGKSTLIKLILGTLIPTTGVLTKSLIHTIYIDQDYSLIRAELSVYEQAQLFNTGLWPEHQVNMRLNRFLFAAEDWGKSCAVLSGGEKMRLLLCAITLSGKSPDLIVLDEPTNNLDIQNLEILTQAIEDYRGTLIVVSHDSFFLNQLQIEHFIDL